MQPCLGRSVMPRESGGGECLGSCLVLAEGDDLPVLDRPDLEEAFGNLDRGAGVSATHVHHSDDAGPSVNELFEIDVGFFPYLEPSRERLEHAVEPSSWNGVFNGLPVDFRMKQLRQRGQVSIGE